jgi:erythromycin esterase
MFVNRTGFRRFFCFLLFVLALAQAVWVQATFPAPGQALAADPVVRWLRQNTLPLGMSEPGGTQTDLAPLQRLIGGARIVGLGEATHGTHEFFTMKARLAEFLISTMGFRTFVMENDWGRSRAIDAYINGAPGDLTRLMAQGLFVCWQTQEYRSFLTWMRAYNASPAHATKIHFRGMDLQDLSPDEFEAVEGYLRTVDVQLVAVVRHLYASLFALSTATTFNTFSDLPVATRQRNLQQAQQVYDLLQANRGRYLARSSASRFAGALQNARIIVQYATYSSYRTEAEALARYYQRDLFLAENVAWLSAHETDGQSKLLIWAHDTHIANDTWYASVDGRNMGGELRAHYGNGYFAIGTTLYQGAFRTYTYPGSTVQSVGPLPHASYNATLGQAGLPLYLLPLDNLPPGPLRAWACSRATLLSYGLGGEDLSAPAQLSQSFDALVHIQQTTPAWPLSLPDSSAHPALLAQGAVVSSSAVA